MPSMPGSMPEPESTSEDSVSSSQQRMRREMEEFHRVALRSLDTPQHIIYDEANSIPSESTSSRLGEIRAHPLPPLRTNGFIAEGEAMWKPPKPRVGVELTAGGEARLGRVLHRVLQQRDVMRARRNLPSERRESEYVSLVLNNARPQYSNPREILESETPVHLDEIDYDTLKTIARNGHKDVFLTEESGNITILCHKCDTKISSVYAFACLGSIYCAEHIPQVEECLGCHQVLPDGFEVKSIDNKIIHVCARCIQRASCRNCSANVPPEYIEFRQCARCYVAKPPSTYPRPYSQNATWMSEDKGRVLDSSRIFSCELETNIPNSLFLQRLVDQLPQEVGMTNDGSIRGEGVGIELQTPKLQGSRGQELVERITSALRSSKATVNDSCGFHIHLDGAGIIPQSRQEYPRALIQLWKTHLVFEDVILSFLPFKRRFNRYCRPMRDYFKLSELSLLTSMFEVEKLWYKQRSYGGIANDKGHHYHPSRYFGLNLHSLLGERNLEIRYHTGTINAKKILHWVNLHSLIMDKAANISGDFLDEAQATPDLKEKTKMLFDAIGLNPKSQSYFFERQNKFSDKGVEEDETVVSPRSRYIISSMGNN